MQAPSDQEDSFDIPIEKQRSPKVGTFLVIGQQIVSIDQELTQTPTTGVRLPGIHDHADRWNQLERENQRAIDQNQYSRGQVVWDAETKRFLIVVSDAVLHDQGTICRIMRTFSLPTHNTFVGSDTKF